MNTSLSNRPARRTAGSIFSGAFVAAMTSTLRAAQPSRLARELVHLFRFILLVSARTFRSGRDKRVKFVYEKDRRCAFSRAMSNSSRIRVTVL